MKIKVEIHRDELGRPSILNIKRGGKKFRAEVTATNLEGHASTVILTGRRESLPDFGEILSSFFGGHIALVSEIGALLSIQAENVEFINGDSSTTVKAGALETVNIKAASGYIYEILAIRMDVGAPAATTTGTHSFSVGSESENVGIGLGQSVFNSEVAYDHKQWRIADSLQRPDGDAGEALCFVGFRFDATNGVDITYNNNTDADQANARTIRLCVRKIKVAN